MNLRFKLTTVILAMILTVIAAISVFTLARASSLQTATTYSFAMEMARAEATEVQRRIEVFVDYAHILAQILGDYEITPEALRRMTYDDVLFSAIRQSPQIMGVWTAWLPGALDGRDAELGQYHSFFTRRNGPVEKFAQGFENWRDYLAAMSRIPTISPPAWHEVAHLGVVPIVNVIYPITSARTGNLVGLVGVNYVSDMQNIVNGIMQRVYGGKGIAGVFASDGTILAHWDERRVQGNIRTDEREIALLGDQHSRVVRAVLGGGEDGQAITLTRHSPAMRTDLHLIYHPIRVSDMDTALSLFIGIPMNEIMREVRETLYITIVFSVLILAAAAVITLFVARSITRPIVAVAGTLREISEGEGDLTKRIANAKHDEIGELARCFNLTLDKIKSLVVAIKKEAADLEEMGSDLARNMGETADSVGDITEHIQSVKGRVMSQSASVTQTHATMKQVVGNINKLNGHVENQNSYVAQASSAIEEMVANISSVTNTLVNNAENM